MQLQNINFRLSFCRFLEYKRRQISPFKHAIGSGNWSEGNLKHILLQHEDVIARWHFVGIFSFLLSRINFWTNIRIGRDLRRHAAYVMVLLQWNTQTQLQKSIIHHPCDMRVRFTERSWPVLCKQIWWLYCICRVGVQALSRFLSDDDSLILCPDWDHI